MELCVERGEGFNKQQPTRDDDKQTGTDAGGQTENVE